MSISCSSLLLLLSVLPIAAAQTCKAVKDEYKKQECCGLPAKKFALDPLQYEYAFSLANLNTALTQTWSPPYDSCTYPVTIPALIASNHSRYSWVPWNKIPDSSMAPSGAFVYKMTDGSYLWKKIASVPIDSPDATLKFTMAKSWTAGTTFQEIGAAKSAPDDYNTLELQNAIFCSEASISLTSEPFSGYQKFVWAAGPFSMAGPDSGCGAFVYEKKDGGIVYHAC